MKNKKSRLTKTLGKEDVSSEERYRLLAENVTDVIFTTDMEFNNVYISPSVEKLRGYTAEEVMSMSMEDSLTPESVHRIMTTFEEERENIFNGTVDSKTLELDFYHKDGSIVNAEVKVSVVYNNLGEPEYLLGVVRDITDRGKYQKALKKASDEWRVTFDTMSDLVMVIDRDGNIQRANRAMAEALNMTFQDMIGRKCYELMHTLDSRIEQCPHEKTVQLKRSVSEEIYIPEMGRYFQVTTNPVFDDEHEVAASVHVMHDITDRHKAEEIIRASEERYRVLAETVTDVIWTMDMNLRPTYVNPAAEVLRGFSAEESMNQKLDQILTPASYHVAMELYREVTTPENIVRVMRSGNTAQFWSRTIEVEAIRKDGTTVWLEAKMTFLRDPEGKPVGLLGVARDIAERKRAEEAKRLAERELEERRKKAIAMDRLRNLAEMARGISHELNQPLLGVRGLAEHISISYDRGWNLPEEEIRDMVKHIISQADRMADIIKHLNTFAAGAAKSELLPIDVNEVISMSKRLLSSQLQSRGYELDFDLAAELPKVLANPFAIEEVLYYLLTNARDATEEKFGDAMDGDNLPTISLTTYAAYKDEGKWVDITVKDTGVGIAQDDIPRVFDPFFTTKPPRKGTGLGLSISKSIIESFGGKIGIASERDKGTSVTISLPALPENGEVK